MIRPPPRSPLFPSPPLSRSRCGGIFVPAEPRERHRPSEQRVAMLGHPRQDAVERRERLGGFLAAFDSVLARMPEDRKSTRLNSRHLVNSYAGFCLEKKKQTC